ncbi:SAM-dependent DNA methyltransferase [Candidatus Poribacteria bacterium]|nr:SAM-dependent DNA methyltransferase [Candidatus Poribacteria bacterium]
MEVNDSIARVAKMNMIIHDDGHSNVISNDALVDFDILYKQHSEFQKEQFDIILTNPPFGAVIKKSELPYLEKYELSKGNTSQKTEILFLERCFDFLKWKTGKLAIILPDGILTNSSLQYVRDYIERHFRILAVVSLPQIAFSHYGAGVKTSILFLQKFSEQEYNRYQDAIDQIEEKNRAIYTPQIEELENERQVIIKKGSPAQVDVTENYRQQFISILDNIDALNHKLGKEPTKKVQNLSAFFFPEIESTPTREFELFDLQAARAELKTQTKTLNDLEKEYRTTFKAAADPVWESEIKTDYKEKIDVVKEEWTDKNAADIRGWIRENANHPIFMAIAERIGYDATGRKDPINDLDVICEEYRKFTENPDFFA